MPHVPPEPAPLKPEDSSLEASHKHSHKKRRSRRKAHKILHESPLLYVGVVVFIIVVLATLMIVVHSRNKALLTDGLRAYEDAQTVVVSGDIRYESGDTQAFTVERSPEGVFIDNQAAGVQAFITADGDLLVEPTIFTLEAIDQAVELSNPAEALRLLQAEAAMTSVPSGSWLRFSTTDDMAMAMDAAGAEGLRCLREVAQFKGGLETDAVEQLVARSYIVENTTEFSRFEAKIATSELGFSSCFTSEADTTLNFRVDKATTRLDRMMIARPEATVELAFDYEAVPRQGEPGVAYDAGALTDLSRREAAAIERRVRERLDSFPVLRNILNELEADEREAGGGL